MAPPDEPIGDDASEDAPDWLVEGDLDSDDAMAWLEEIAAKYDPNFEKSLDEGDPVADEPVASLDAAPETAEEEQLPDWLSEDTASPPPDAEIVPVSEEEDAVPDWLKDEPTSATLAEDTAADELDELPDWLREDSPPATPDAGDETVESLPDWLSEDEPEPMSEAKTDEDEDELAWLREPTETPIVSAADEDEGDLPDWLKDEEPAPVPIGEVEDTEDALAWLNEHVAEQGIDPTGIVSNELTVDTPPTTPITATPLPDAQAEAVSDEELPEWLREAGGTEAMAEALASESSEFDIDDIPELDADEDELAWLADTLEAESQKADENLEALLGELDAEEKPEEITSPEPEIESEPVAQEIEAEELPDWLTEEEPKPSPGLTDWLKSPTPPVEVEAEEEETELEPVLAAEAEETEIEEQAKPAKPEIVPDIAAPVHTEVDTRPVEIPEALKGDFMGQLNTARDKLKVPVLEDALPLYENLISHGQMLEQTISDLEYAVQFAEKSDPRVRRVLGDALRADGRLQDALEAYRAALDEL